MGPTKVMVCSNEDMGTDGKEGSLANFKKIFHNNLTFRSRKKTYLDYDYRRTQNLSYHL